MAASGVVLGKVLGAGGGGGGGGDTVGPASSTDLAITRFSGTTGKLLKNSLLLLSDAGSISGIPSGQTVDGRNLKTDGTKLDGIEAGAQVTSFARVAAALAVASADVAFNARKLTGILDPTNAQEAATKAYVDALKAYVDALVQGLDVKGSSRAMSTSNITLSGTQTIDGVACIAGNRVLVNGQTLGQNNGIYDVAAGAWTRSGDADTSAEVTSGMYTFVSEGTANGGKGFALTTPDPITLGTTPLTFTQFTTFALSNVTPLMDGVGAAGATGKASDSGHVHPTDTSKQDVEVYTGVKTANYAANINEYVTCDVTSGGFTVTIPTAVGNAGKRVRVKRVSTGANTITIATTSGQTIDNLAASTFNILGTYSTESNYLELVSDGANWFTPQYQPILVAAPSALGPAAASGAARTVPRSDHVHKISMAVRAQTGTSDTLVLADQNAIVTESNAGAISQTVPPNSSVAFEIGCTVTLPVIGGGQVTIVEGAGVTVNSKYTKKSNPGAFAVLTLMKLGTDTWLLTGDLAVT